MKMLDAEASVSLPSRKRTVSAPSSSAESWRSRQLPMSEIDLMSQRSQRLSCALIAMPPFCTFSCGGLTSGLDASAGSILFNSSAMSDSTGTYWVLAMSLA